MKIGKKSGLLQMKNFERVLFFIPQTLFEQLTAQNISGLKSSRGSEAK